MKRRKGGRVVKVPKTPKGFSDAWVNWIVEVRQPDDSFREARVIDFSDEDDRLLVQYEQDQVVEWKDCVVRNFKLLRFGGRDGTKVSSARAFTEKYCMVDKFVLPLTFEEELENEPKQQAKRGRKKKQAQAVAKGSLSIADSLEMGMPEEEDACIFNLRDLKSLNSLSKQLLNSQKNSTLENMAGSILALDILLSHAESPQMLASVSAKASEEERGREGEEEKGKEEKAPADSEYVKFCSTVIHLLGNAGLDAKQLCRRSFAHVYRKNTRVNDAPHNEFLKKESENSDEDENTSDSSSDEDESSGDDEEQTAFGNKGAQLKGPLRDIRFKLDAYLQALRGRASWWSTPSISLVEDVCRGAVLAAMSPVFSHETAFESYRESFDVLLECTSLALCNLADCVIVSAKAAASRGEPFNLKVVASEQLKSIPFQRVVKRILDYQLLFARVVSVYRAISLRHPSARRSDATEEEKENQGESNNRQVSAETGASRKTFTMMRKTMDGFQTLAKALALGVAADAVAGGPNSNTSSSDLREMDGVISAMLQTLPSAQSCRMFGLKPSPDETRVAGERENIWACGMETEAAVLISAETLPSGGRGGSSSSRKKARPSQAKEKDVDWSKYKIDQVQSLIRWSQDFVHKPFEHMALTDSSPWTQVVQACAVAANMGCDPRTAQLQPWWLSTKKKTPGKRGRKVLQESTNENSNFITPPPTKASKKSDVSIDITKNVDRVSKLSLEPLLKDSRASKQQGPVFFQKSQLSVGRSLECELRFSGTKSDKNLMCISRLHAKLYAREKGILPEVTLECISSNGVLVNRSKVKKGVKTPIKPGDLINFCVIDSSDRCGYTYRLVLA